MAPPALRLATRLPPRSPTFLRIPSSPSLAAALPERSASLPPLAELPSPRLPMACPPSSPPLRLIPPHRARLSLFPAEALPAQPPFCLAEHPLSPLTF